VDEVEGYTILNGLGTGRFSRVYEVNNDKTSSSSIVAKCFQFPFHEKGGHEKEILTLLQNHNIANIPKCQDLVVGPDSSSSSSVLILSPVGIPIIFASQNNFITPNMILTLLDVLQFAHNLNIVHRDVKPENIFLNRNNLNEIILNDWGSAVRLDLLENDGECDYEGTPLYGEEQPRYHGRMKQVPTKKLDLRCLVKTAFTIKQQKYPRSKMTWGEIEAYWGTVSRKSPHFQNVLNFAENEDYDALRNFFQGIWF
jgi:serine/threonine protein kinase